MTSFWIKLTNFYNHPLLKLGNAFISLNAIISFICLSILLILLARAIKLLCKKWLLAKLGLDVGNREAFSTLIAYLIGILGTIGILQATGIDFSALAVIVGGLGIGVGFGLQNLTKDLISGIILLFNRNIRVDNFIQFGKGQDFSDLNGTVVNIRLLSTVVRSKDGGCMIVPNSYLVEKPILNWNYDNEKNRVKASFYINKESDLVLVTEVILNAAYNEVMVSDYPYPVLQFKGLREYYWEFELQVWISTFRDEDMVRTALNYAIQYHLQQQGISLIYPFEQFLKKLEDFPTLPIASSPAPEKSLSPPKNKPITVRQLLPQIQYFAHLTDLELRRFIELGKRQRLRQDEILFNEGDKGDSFYIILEGAVEVFVPKINKHLTTLEKGAFFGELSLLLGIPRTASVKAVESCLLFAIDHVKFKKLMQEYPEVAMVILQELETHQDELLQRKQQLRELGLLDDDDNENSMMLWIRKRFNQLFA